MNEPDSKYALLVLQCRLQPYDVRAVRSRTGITKEGTVSSCSCARPPGTMPRIMIPAVDVVEIIDALESADVDVWVYGGWGIDALLGEETRLHDDLDVIIRADDIEAATRATREMGFSLMTDELPQGFVVRDRVDRRIDFHPVRFQSDGSAVQEINSGGVWVFSAPGLLGVGSVNGREIRCLTPEEQAVRASDQPGVPGYEPAETDRRDMQLLRSRFGITLPYPYANDSA